MNQRNTHTNISKEQLNNMKKKEELLKVVNPELKEIQNSLKLGVDAINKGQFHKAKILFNNIQNSGRIISELMT